MKRWPLVANFVLFVALCACTAYWAMQLFKPPLRPIAAPRPVQTEVGIDAAASIFGGRGAKEAVASNYQLRGVIFSGRNRESVAILSADGKPAQAIGVDMEVLPGVTVKEVHRDYILLSDNGVIKRVELPEDAKGKANTAAAVPVGVVPAPTRPASMPATSSASNQPAPQPSSAPQPGPPPAQTAAPASPRVAQQQPSAPQPVPAPAPTVQTAPPEVVVSPRPSTGAAPLNPPSPSSDSTFGTPSPPLYSPGRAAGMSR